MRKRKIIPVVDKAESNQALKTAETTGESGSAVVAASDRQSRGNEDRQSDRAGAEPSQETTNAVSARTQGAAETAKPEETVESLGAQVAELEDKLLRAKAEFANLQRRAAAERLQATRFATVDLVRPILNVIDDFERSLAHEVEGEEAKGVLTGVRLVYENLMKVLRDHGLTVIEATGKPFDPNFHEAAMRQPTSAQPPGTVVQEVSKGYQLHDRVIRPTKVVVAAEPPCEEDESKADAAV